jgi:hypothetical protein
VALLSGADMPRCRANKAASVVLPAPPFPTNAIFINGVFLSGSSVNGFDTHFQ